MGAEENVLFKVNAAPTINADKEAHIAPSRPLEQKLGALRRRTVSVAVLTGIAIVVGVCIEVLALAMFLDWWLDLPRSVRAVMLLGQAAIFGFIVFYMIVRPMLQQPSTDELALRVEKAHPEFRGRLISSVQLTREGALGPNDSAAIVGAMVNQTEAVAVPMDFSRIVSTERLKNFGLMAGMVAVLAIAGMAFGSSVTLDLLKRVFLSNTPVPRKTRVFVVEADKLIGRGDNVRLEAYVNGIEPSGGKLLVRYRGRREQTYVLEADRERKAFYGRTLENVQDSFTYQIRLNDGVSSWHTVTAVPRPAIATVACEQVFPAYTKLPPVRRSLGDLTLLAGSILKLQATATRDLKSAAIRLSGAEGEFPMQSASVREITGQFTVPAKGLNGFSIHMLDTSDMESRDSAIYRVEILPDKVPVVRLTFPERKEELVTRQALLVIGMDVTDDFQVSKLRLRYRADTLDNGEEKILDLDLGSEGSRRIKRRFEWNLSNFKPLLPEGTRIEYWVEAEDNNDATGPGVGSSEHQFAKVVSVEEKRADLLNRAGDYLGSINDVAADQEKINQSLGQIIREKLK